MLYIILIIIIIIIIALWFCYVIKVTAGCSVSIEYKNTAD